MPLRVVFCACNRLSKRFLEVVVYIFQGNNPYTRWNHRLRHHSLPRCHLHRENPKPPTFWFCARPRFASHRPANIVLVDLRKHKKSPYSSAASRVSFPKLFIASPGTSGEKKISEAGEIHNRKPTQQNVLRKSRISREITTNLSSGRWSPAKRTDHVLFRPIQISS